MADAISNLSDAELIELGEKVAAALLANPPASYGTSAGVVTALGSAFTTYKDDVTNQSIAVAAAQASTATKNTSRGTYQDQLRQLVAIAKASGTTDTNMALLGLPNGGGAPAATVPLAVVDTSQRMTHTISWGDAADAGRQRRPKGVMGAEIWVKIGDPAPGDEKDCTFVAIDSATPYVASYPPEDGGKVAYYMLRWRMRDGSVSPWGETVNATITA